MKRLRIYVDTSVIGGCFDPEFKEWSVALVDDFRLGRYVPVISDVTAAEILAAPGFVRELHAEMLRLFNAVNIEQGYKPISVYSPREVISYGQED